MLTQLLDYNNKCDFFSLVYISNAITLQDGIFPQLFFFKYKNSDSQQQ